MSAFTGWHPRFAFTGARIELHDGQVVSVPLAKPLHILAKSNIQLALTLAEPTRFRAVVEFPYRPQPDLQFWYADVAWVPVADLARVLRRSDYVCYAPPLIVEVLSPSNRATTVNRSGSWPSPRVPGSSGW